MLGSCVWVLYFAFYDKEQVSIELQVFSNASDIPPFLSHRVECRFNESESGSRGSIASMLNSTVFTWFLLVLENLSWPAALQFSRLT